MNFYDYSCTPYCTTQNYVWTEYVEFLNRQDVKDLVTFCFIHIIY